MASELNYSNSTTECPGISAMTVRLAARFPTSIANTKKCQVTVTVLWYSDPFLCMYDPTISNMVLSPTTVESCLNLEYQPTTSVNLKTFYVVAYIMDEAMSVLKQENTTRAMAKMILLASKSNIIEVVMSDKIIQEGVP